jgi:DNA-binding PadR family transcriptional regulator
MRVPELTALQFALLDCLLAGERNGESLRELLAQRGYRKSLGAFYQLMARVEDAKFVAGRYEQKVVKGYTVRERRYQITGDGETAVARTREFYQRRPAVAGPEGVAYV